MLFGSEKKPKGPDLRKSRMVEKNLSGTKLKFMVPPHRDPLSNLGNWEEEPSAFNIDDKSTYKALETRDKSGNKRTFDFLHVARIYSSIWEFRGRPLLDGYCGDVVFLADVLSVQDIPINESLFDNRVLAREAYRAFDLTELQDLHKGHSDDPGDLTSYRWPSYLGPVNCQWVKTGQYDWLYFEDQPLFKKDQTLSWYTAISDSCYLRCRFSFTRSARNAGNPYRIEQRVTRDNFIDLIQNIMDTMTLELSPESDKCRNQIQLQVGADSKPHLSPSKEQIEQAKYVVHMWSDREYQDNSIAKDADHRANPEDVATFIDQRLKPRALPNSYPLGEPLTIVKGVNEDSLVSAQD